MQQDFPILSSKTSHQHEILVDQRRQAAQENINNISQRYSETVKRKRLLPVLPFSDVQANNECIFPTIARMSNTSTVPHSEKMVYPEYKKKWNISTASYKNAKASKQQIYI